MTKAQKSIITVAIIRGADCTADMVVNTIANAKSVMQAAKLIAREYKEADYASGFSADMQINGVSVNPFTDISYASPVISTRAIIATCATKSAHIAMSKELAAQ